MKSTRLGWWEGGALSLRDGFGFLVGDVDPQGDCEGFAACLVGVGQKVLDQDVNDIVAVLLAHCGGDQHWFREYRLLLRPAHSGEDQPFEPFGVVNHEDVLCHHRDAAGIVGAEPGIRSTTSH